ncbi:MAG: hypothetical protein K8I03_16345 [Ignavibacteria bacterium]|nr:hypothetical protein [Ignavibacteria bacterium]
MKLVLSTIIVGIILFLLGWLSYGMVLAEYLKPYYGFMQRPDSDMKIWAFALASFVQALFLYVIYNQGYKGGSSIIEGSKFGIVIGLFTSIPYVLFTWGGMKVPYKAVIPDGIAVFIMMLIAGIITAFIHGKRDVKVLEGK